MLKFLNGLTHSAIVLILFFLGCAMAIAGFLVVAHYPAVPEKYSEALAALGGSIVVGAMMAFRGTNPGDAPPSDGDKPAGS